MFEWIAKHKIISAVSLTILSVFIIILIPLIINKVYYLNAPCNFFEVSYDLSNILDYYGAVLSFGGTLILGFITLRQNHIAQKKTDEVNKLTLELQRKSMAMAEQMYEKEKQEKINKNTLKFELKNQGMNGNHMNLTAKFKNVSNIIVSGIKSVAFEVVDESNNVLMISSNVKCSLSSLSPGEEMRIEFQNKPLINDNESRENRSLKNINIIWSFQCEDPLSNIQYYKAKLYIKNSNDFETGLWDIEKVG